MQIPETIRNFLSEISGFGDFAFYVGFSGGADSTALVVALAEAGVGFTAVHCEHGIRGQASIADAEWCEKFCASLGIPFLRRDLRVLENLLPGEGVEEAARRLRLAAFENLPSQTTDKVIFLAHHKDDAKENLILRMGRGGNASGLTGLRKIRRLGNLLLCRPLLDFGKEELISYLKAHNIDDWRQDGTNNESVYRRNGVRNELLPLWRKIMGSDEGLNRSLTALTADAEYLEQTAEQILPTLQTLADWRHLHRAIFVRVLRLWLGKMHNSDARPLCRETIERVAKEIREFRGGEKSVPLEGGMELIIKASGLTLASAKSPALVERKLALQAGNALFLPEIGKTIRISSEKGQEKFDGAILRAHENTLTIRGWCPGDRMQPFGARFKKKLQDIFTDAKIFGKDRQDVPVILVGDEIIWLAGVRRGEIARVTPETQEMIYLSIE